MDLDGTKYWQDLADKYYQTAVEFNNSGQTKRAAEFYNAYLWAKDKLKQAKENRAK